MDPYNPGQAGPGNPFSYDGCRLLDKRPQRQNEHQPLGLADADLGVRML
nr:hypothetical protein [Streptomyces sp. FBKL.4005]